MELWEKQEGETPKQYYYFSQYRDLGVFRSVKKMLEVEGKYSRTAMRRIQKISVERNWVKRVAAYDEYCCEQARIQAEQEILEMNKRHIQQSLLMQKNVIQKLNDTNPKELSMADCSRMYDVAVKVERQARGVKNGESTVEIKNSVELREKNEMPLDKMSREDREAYLEMLRKYSSE